MPSSTPPTITDLISLQGEWSIEGLLNEWRALEPRLQPSTDARVSAHLDARSVRYYQTLNLLPKPRRYDGRRAIYGAEHLVRLVCIRALQGQGRSLSEVQRVLDQSGDGRLWLLAMSALGVSDAQAGTFEEGRRSSVVTQEEPPPLARPLLEYTLRPGVVLMVDPELVLDPEGLVDALVAHLRAPAHGDEGETSDEG
jgi:DNA-binding transcriptional MerR regulator